MRLNLGRDDVKTSASWEWRVGPLLSWSTWGAGSLRWSRSVSSRLDQTRRITQTLTSPAGETRVSLSRGSISPEQQQLCKVGPGDAWTLACRLGSSVPLGSVDKDQCSKDFNLSIHFAVQERNQTSVCVFGQVQNKFFLSGSRTHERQIIFSLGLLIAG